MAKKIDPRVYMPPVEGYEYEESSRVPFTDATPSRLEPPPGTGEGLQPPSNVTIVEQIFRKDAAGKTVVDLIIEVEDMPGATEYEIRTSIV